MSQPETPEPAGETTPSTTPKIDELPAIVKRVNEGDPKALKSLRAYLQAWPQMAICVGGDLSWEATSLAVKRFAGKDLAGAEAVLHQLNSLRYELCGENKYPTGIERLLIEHVVGTWLHLHILEVEYALRESPRFSTDAFYQKELTAAQHRYLTAIRVLAETRRKLQPNIQINLARKQVNIAGSATVTRSPAPQEAAPAPPG